MNNHSKTKDEPSKFSIICSKNNRIQKGVKRKRIEESDDLNFQDEGSEEKLEENEKVSKNDDARRIFKRLKCEGYSKQQDKCQIDDHQNEIRILNEIDISKRVTLTRSEAQQVEDENQKERLQTITKNVIPEEEKFHQECIGKIQEVKYIIDNYSYKQHETFEDIDLVKKEKSKKDDKSCRSLSQKSRPDLLALIDVLYDLFSSRLEVFNPELLISSMVMQFPLLREPLRRCLKIMMTTILQKKKLTKSLRQAINALGDCDVRRTLKRTKRPLMPRNLPKNVKKRIETPNWIEIIYQELQKRNQG